jgi:16S rRNA (cytidine1402-2'-O)-methyltransferase
MGPSIPADNRGVAGNLGDVTERARRTLASVDVVACEDTRRTGRLLAALGVEGPRLVSFFEGNEARRVPELVEALREGADVALVSDAGMPGVSDPGYRLVATCLEAGVGVEVVPGPSAVVAALVVSGLPTDRFAFEGFLPRSGRARAERLSAIAAEDRTVVVFESPRRVTATLRDLLEAVGDVRVAVVRELTKLHQEVIRGTVSEALAGLEGRELKGEVVLVVEGGRRARAEGPGGSGEEASARALRLASELVRAGARKREAARRAAAATGVPARRIYQALTGSRA